MNFFYYVLELIHSGTFNVFWLFYLGYVFIVALLGYSAFSEQKPVSGWLFLAGAIALLAGIFIPLLTVIPFIWLWPLAIVMLLKKRDPRYYNILYTAVAPVLLLLMNRTYGII